MNPPLILVLCTGNSCRSHMGEGILRALLPPEIEVASAGSHPSGYVHPLAIRVMGEIGIDLSTHRSKHLNEFLDRSVSLVITVCGNADQVCPSFPGAGQRVHLPFEDPAHAQGSEAEQLLVFRKVRDEIRQCFEAHAPEWLAQWRKP